jgi:Flp pilus assembly pilin Flp
MPLFTSALLRSARLSAAVRRFRAESRDDTGAATAEYAVATMAAVGFAGLLVVILRSDEVREILTELVRNALTFTG